ncbi:peptidase [Streptomyces sp. NPDC059402]|uniref:peptidase n=1 Tax=Streptomyces sp. NPDC059402 TaxID=3346822 RepID=UPI00368AEC20
MKIRRVLATAVAAAVISPVALLSAAPAFADEKPATQQTQKAKPTVEELEQAVERAQKEYDAAVVAVNDAVKFLTEDMEADTYPTKAAVIETEKAAAAAAQAKTEADQAVADARAKLEAAATDEDKAAAQTALDEAEKAAKEAADAKTAADAKATEARTAHDDARVAQARKIGLLQKAKKEAKAKLADAEKALADAKAAAEEGEENGENGENGEGEEGGEAGEDPVADCVPEPRLTAVVTGLPDKVVGGTTETFSLRVTNGTGETMDAVYPYVGVHAFDVKGLKELDSYLDLEWSTAANPTWRDADLIDATSLGSLKAKASVDVKLRLKVDPDVPAGQGAAFVTADYVNEDGSCGGYPDLDHHEFQILAKSDDGGDTPGKDDGTKDKSDNTTEQGGASTTPVNTSGGSGSGSGSLAHTGSSDVLPKVGLAGGAALVLGAGAVLVARRRKTATES